MEAITRDHLAAAVEATRLGPGLSAEGVRRFVREAIRLGVGGGVCVPPCFLADAASIVSTARASLDLVTVANFPFGQSCVEGVGGEVRACAGVADHVDIVAPVHTILEGDWRSLHRFLAACVAAARQASGPGRLRTKVILETATLTTDQIRAAAEVAIEAGADWLKTSTGYHPDGGATPEAVALLRDVAPKNVGVKASGGIRTREQAERMLLAGADRIGTSSEQSVLGGPDGESAAGTR